MFRKAFSFGGLLLLAGALVLVTPGSGQARPRGGGGFHGGGFHGGGFRGGGFHGGINRGFRGGINRGFRGGFNRGFHGRFNHDFRRGFHDRFNRGRWWYPGIYGYSGAWPDYYGSYPYSGYSDYYADPYGSDGSSPADDLGYSDSYGNVTSSYLGSDLSGAAQPDTRAEVTVTLPADAELWFEGTKMISTGSVREFHSPPLAPGSQYTYQVRASWNENGHEVAQTQQVNVAAAAHISVKFPVQPTSGRTATND